eukprot:scaffold14680_cov69-Cylindrotheca_fusiformis.AAC.1
MMRLRNVADKSYSPKAPKAEEYDKKNHHNSVERLKNGILRQRRTLVRSLMLIIVVFFVCTTMRPHALEERIANRRRMHDSLNPDNHSVDNTASLRSKASPTESSKRSEPKVVPLVDRHNESESEDDDSSSTTSRSR